MGDLFFGIGDNTQKGSLSEMLGLLVTVDLLFLDELVERLVRIFGEDGVDLCAGILNKWVC